MEQGAGQARPRLGTRWGRYEVRKAMQACDIFQHMHCRCHKTAMQAYLQPDTPVQVVLQPHPGDDALLAGATPQPPDWLRAFRIAKSPVSYETAAASAATEHYICNMRAKPVHRKAIKSQVAIMAEAVRHQKREWVRNAFAVTLGLDDKGPHRLIMFKVDDEVGAADASLRQTNRGARMGVLAALRTSSCKSEIEDFEEDYGKRMCESIIKSIRDFCTPMGEFIDDALCQHFLQSIRTFVADGAPSVQKAGLLLKQTHCPNLVLVLRDPSHAIRIACRDPLHNEARFGEQWDRLFGSKHAVIGDIQNSDVLKAKLMACQKRVLQVDGTQGGCKRELRNVFHDAHWCGHERYQGVGCEMHKLEPVDCR